MDWKYFLKIAYEEAKKSADPSTQNAALLINDTGTIILEDINRFPDGVKKTKERWRRPLKYEFVEHAERNVCYKAASLGIATFGLIMVCPWAACPDCARAIIQCGIKMLVTHKQAHDRSPKQWADKIKVAFEQLKEAEVEVVMYSGKIGVKNILHSEELWTP